MQGNRKLNLTLMATAAALTGVFALSAVKPAEAQRKSIRWATSSVDYLRLQSRRLDDQDRRRGARRRIHRHRQSLSATTGADEGRDGWQWRDRLHRRHRHDASSMTSTSGFKGYTAAKGRAGAHLVRLSDGILHGDHGAARRARCKCLKDFSGQPVFFTPGRLHELAELPAHLQDARLRLQARADRSEDAVGRAAGRHHRRLGRLHGLRRVARAVLEGDRDPHGHPRRQSVPGRSRQAQRRRPGGRRRRSEGRVHQGRRRERDPRRADPVRLQRAPRHAGGRRLQDAQRLLQEPRQARDARLRLQRAGEGLRRHAGRRASTPIRTFPCMPASPSS